MNSKHNFFVIGSGFSSLAAACYLANAGKKVTVLEKNEQLGGRASVLEENGFRFDMGPSWYWMPDVFEKFFADFGLKVADFYELEKLNPAYRVYFGENDFIDISEDLNQIISTFDAIDEGSGERLKKFLNQAEKNYEIAMQDLVYQPGISITELVTAQTTTRLPLFFKNISSQASSITKNKKLQSILEFPVLFLGAKPQNTPAFYNFMNWADFGLGTWYPKGGMNQIVQAMVKLATDLGVDFQLNEDVTSINIHNKKVTSVTTNNALSL